MSTCYTCPIYRPDEQKARTPARPPVCDGDRRLLDSHLWDIPDLYERLPDEQPAPANAPYLVELPSGTLEQRGFDPVADLLPAGPVRGLSRQPRVSGSKEPPAPTSVDRIDLTLPARQGSVALWARAEFGQDPDQDGILSVATILDCWVRDWREALWPDHSLPAPTVPELARWLRNRVEDACDQHPAIDEFAAEMKDVRYALRRELGETEAQPETEPYKGVACQKCDLRGVLMRKPGQDYIECKNCGMLMTGPEYEYWRDRLAGFERSQRRPDEIAEVLRRPVTRRDAA
jgi:hypothetical protein